MFPPMRNANELMVQAAAVGIDGIEGFDGRTSISRASWLNNQSKLEQLHELRVMTLSNARIIYGFEKFKSYDVVVAYSELDAKFAAILVCNFNDATKILRKVVAGCPLAATRAIVYGLQIDTGLLLSKYNVGDQLFGQQGSTPPEGRFELHEWRHAANDPKQDQDDTSSLVPGNFQAPIGPRAHRHSFKRTRRDAEKGDYWDRPSESREVEGRLNYDD